MNWTNYKSNATSYKTGSRNKSKTSLIGHRDQWNCGPRHQNKKSLRWMTCWMWLVTNVLNWWLKWPDHVSTDLKFQMYAKKWAHMSIFVLCSRGFKTLAVSRYNGRDNDGNNYYRFILQQTFVIFIALTCLYHVSSLSVHFEINVRTFVVREHKSLTLLCLTINCNTYSLKKKRIMHLNVF